jgi:predicted ATPase
MKYIHTDVDIKNLNWFKNDVTRATLLAIEVYGRVRGLIDVKMDFHYPITVIAGKNGTGKSTILGLAACAYHNFSRGFLLPGRKVTYYTFGDFFVGTDDESLESGYITIRYKFLYNHWRPRKEFKSVGEGWQRRYKQYSNRWNRYSSRVKRPVVYLGINRIVPHAERNLSKTSRKQFQTVEAKGWEDNLRRTVSQILDANYESFDIKERSKHRLPVVSNSGSKYSGFNMGAGEDALFDLFYTINECPDGSLLIIDEIELGLHEQAQIRLMDELKQICEQRKFQIICTTHSPAILDQIPPEGRIFLEKHGDKTIVIPGITSSYAAGKLSGQSNSELDILVEDETAQTILENCLSNELRHRVKIIPIGSSVAVVRHMAARYKDKTDAEVCVFLDGDKRSSQKSHISEFLKALEKADDTAEQWIEKRLMFLPGNGTPESWVIEQRSEKTYERFTREFEISKEQVDEMFDVAKRAKNNHNAFFDASRVINCDKTQVAYNFIKGAIENSPNERQQIVDFLLSLLQ